MRFFCTFLLASLLVACSPQHDQTNTAPAAKTVIKTPPEKQKQEIVFVTHYSPTTYYLNGDDKLAGIEYDLAMLFAKKYATQYTIKFLVVHNISEVIPTLLAGKADIAASSLTISDLRKSLIQFSTPYQETQQQLVFNSELSNKPNNLAEISHKKIIIPAGTSYAERLQLLQIKHPKLNWQVDPKSNAEFLLDQVASGDLSYSIADSQLVSLMQNYFPNLEVAMDIGKPENMAWAFSQKADPKLVKDVNQFLAQIKQNGQLRNLIDRYYGHADRLNTNDISHFLQHINTLLPKYKRLFQQAEAQTGLDWRLIAAVSYRESHWDTFSTSPTNVRGLMMLTEDTADYMGVTDRLDPKQSIPAGAKYILKMKAIFPKKIPEPDRTYFGLASYNIGYAHVQDARTLAKRLGLQQDSWADVKKTLVMLTNPEYYKLVKYGYASGGAPVVFVESVRSYQRILERYQPNPQQDINSFNLASNK